VWSAVEDAKDGELVIPGDLLSVAGNMILDGHHRWSGTMALNPNAQIGVRNFDVPGSGGTKLGTLQVAIAGERKAGHDMPSKGGSAAQNILGESAASIAELISSNVGKKNEDDFLAEKMGAPIFMGDKWIQEAKNGSDAAKKMMGLTDELLGKALPESAFGKPYKPEGEEKEIAAATGKDCPCRSVVIEKVASNLGGMKARAANTPENREDMPQLDHKEIGGSAGFNSIIEKLPKGELNVAEPFMKESINLKRWTKLAGLLKD